jgi:hypothetical protein
MKQQPNSVGKILFNQFQKEEKPNSEQNKETYFVRNGNFHSTIIEEQYEDESFDVEHRYLLDAG